MGDYMSSNRTLAAAAFLALGLGGCATTAGSAASTFAGLTTNVKDTHTTFNGTFYDTLDMQTVAQGHYDFSEEDLQRLALTGGDDAAKGFLGVAHATSYLESGRSLNLVVDESITGPLHAIRDRLLAAWDGPAPEIEIFVSGEQGYHGQAFSKNFIIIPVGALVAIADERTEIDGQETVPASEDELAAFIAHEMSHILLGHYQRGESASLRDKLNNSAAGLTAVGVVLGGLEMTGSGDNRQIQLADEQRSSDLMRKVMVGHALLSESNRLLSASASREQEDHADLLAMDLLVRAGYEPDKMKDFLERSRQAQVMAAARLEDLNDQQKILASELASTTGAGQGNFLMDLGFSIGMNFVTDWMQRASATHRTTEKRIVNTVGYEDRLTNTLMTTYAEGGSVDGTEAFYLSRLTGEAAEATAGNENLQSLRQGRASELLQAYRDAFTADNYLTGNNAEVLEAAGELLGNALEAGSTEPEILLIASRYYAAMGRPADRVRVLELAVEQPGSGPLNFAELANAYHSNGQFPSMLSAIEKGEKETGTEAPFFHLRIAYLASQSLWNEAVAVNEKCKATEAANYVQLCAEAMAPVNAELERQRQEKATKNPLSGLFGK